MFFPSFSDADMPFSKVGGLIWRNFTAIEVLSTTKKVELINKRQFPIVALDKNTEILVVYIAAWLAMDIHLSIEAQSRALLVNETLIKVLAEYSNYIDVFSPNLLMELPEHTHMNVHAINLIKDK